jgi:hypothetical protein
VEARGELVTRDEVQKTIWGDDIIVDFEQGINKAVKQIRAALEDVAEEPLYVQTVPRRGYRFAGEVRIEGPEAEPGERERDPYPGLREFTESDAPFFFGREQEVESLWRRIESNRLLALIGPSGAGKSSFLRAGLLPSRPLGWSVVLATPGNAPLSAIARALVPVLEGDTRSIQELVTADRGRLLVAAASWSRRCPRALLVVDAFEELFTQTPPPVQREVAALLGHVAREFGVHVLLSMRDDFLFRCHDHPALAPIFRDLTPLGPPTGDALRRALVEPAARSGYRFETEEMIDQMLLEVAKERGALPLLAFAAARGDVPSAVENSRQQRLLVIGDTMNSERRPQRGLGVRTSGRESSSSAGACGLA